MIHAKRLSHPCVTCEAQVVIVRQAGVGLEPVVDSAHAPHVHFPLLQLADSVWLPKEHRPNSSEGSICLS
jgi:hypothetical protein